MNDPNTPMQAVTCKGMELLERAAHRAFTHPEELAENFRLVGAAEHSEDLVGMTFVVAAVRQIVAGNFLQCRVLEQDVYRWFSSHGEDLLGDGYRIVKRKSDRAHIPDFWIDFRGAFVPVEVKRGPFDEKALRQLSRYMRYYGCSAGVAVGSRLDCGVPPNVRFVRHPLGSTAPPDPGPPA